MRRHISKGDFNETVAASQQHTTNNHMYMPSKAMSAYIDIEGYTHGYIQTVNAEKSTLF